MAGQASISSDILARYAGDAAREVPGVRGLAGRKSVRVDEGDGVRVELHLAVEWGASIPEVGRGVQERVREYLISMADVRPGVVDVVVDEVGPLR
ncbi:MAG TPA: Asp23/Gls24 family envelope stress response protein [Gaiellaceae bacterium]|nr:Asp23/Gls24 family envelope stress response protein [Gaiellaceae bacterium]